MSLDLYIRDEWCEHCGRYGDKMWHGNITHNLSGMARAAGVYEVIWRSYGNTAMTRDALPIVRAGIAWLEANADTAARTYEPANKWGTVESLLGFLRSLEQACAANPDASLESIP